MASMKIVQFSRPPLSLSSYVQNSSTILTLDVQFQTTSSPHLSLQIIANQLKENIIQEWLLYIIRSFIQVGFWFQFQLINLVWLSIDFSPFSWSQPCPESYFLKLKTFFSVSSHCKNICWVKMSWILFRGFTFLCVQLFKNNSFAIIQVFTTYFAINLFYLHILKP